MPDSIDIALRAEFVLEFLVFVTSEIHIHKSFCFISHRRVDHVVGLCIYRYRYCNGSDAESTLEADENLAEQDLVPVSGFAFHHFYRIIT